MKILLKKKKILSRNWNFSKIDMTLFFELTLHLFLYVETKDKFVLNVGLPFKRCSKNLNPSGVVVVELSHLWFYNCTFANLFCSHLYIFHLEVIRIHKSPYFVGFYSTESLKFAEMFNDHSSVNKLYSSAIYNYITKWNHHKRLDSQYF